MKKYIFIDIENPNCKNNSICSIGIVVVEDGIIVNKLYSLINPEDRFDTINSSITGIVPSMIQNSPTLVDYWPLISELFKTHIIVGHNVSYDLSIINKSLYRYNISFDKLKYYDTLELSKKYIKSDSYKLDVLTNFIGYSHKHHNALEDAVASYEVFNYILKNNNIGIPHIFNSKIKLNENLDSKLESNINKLYGIIKGISYDDEINKKEILLLKKWIEENEQNKIYSAYAKIINQLTKILEDNIIDDYERITILSIVQSIKHSKIYNETTLSLQILHGILQGIIADDIVNEKEINNLYNWLKDHDYLSDVYPYDRVYKVIKKVLSDGKITNGEYEFLKISFNEIFNPYKEIHSFDLNGKTYCLTGDFQYGKKSDISSLLISKGAIEKSGVTSKLDFLFVGTLGSQAWKFGNSGGKIQKAQQFQEKGSSIQIISEKDLFSLMNLNN